MPKNAIIDRLKTSPYFIDKLSKIKSGQKIIFSGLVGSSKAAIIAGLSRHFKSIFIVTASSAKAEKIKVDIEFFLDKKIDLLPAPDNEAAGQRQKIIRAWNRDRKMLVVAPLKAALAKTNRQIEVIQITENQKIDLEELVKKLIVYGYKRFEIVGEIGEFSVRGGIVDVFPISCAFPVRLEFSEDNIGSIREFDCFSQRSVKKVREIEILPVLEKPEAAMLDVLPENTLVIVDERLEVERDGEDLSLLWKRQDIELSVFLREGEEPAFSAPPNYAGKIIDIPPASIVVSHHAARLKEELPEHTIIEGELCGGFIFGSFELLSDRELFGEELFLRRVEPVSREGVDEDLLADLKVGDYVVHENYGIGIYQGMHKIAIEEVTQEYLLIEYASEDKLFVPPHMAGLVEKYSGGREVHPRLSRLGTREWLHTRTRVKKAVQDMARELIALYAGRKKVGGHAFPPDDLWQKELEATFPFEETPDQLKAIMETKKDMEALRPMDRLICGDVGYGKTEVAIRAAAKAAAAGKQVAILAPTTILVEQHYNNFKQRFKNQPFNVEMLSRFRSAKEQKEIVKLLAAGGVDIIIGTHRLLSKDIQFKELGLLIIDEEQKFGVAHKEKLKKLRLTVDVLTLSATPIPRTLYFSLSGVRELSMITTPPVDRSPIRTYVLPFSEKVIQEAIKREIDRGGQIYFVHNFVETIVGMASAVKRLVPEARVAIAHGQMDGKTLEKTMLNFLGRKYDVLVCTSIIESGLDMPNVNTILIDQADRLGLSQLYQIRGRVGRSAVRAYAYLFYHPARTISDQALERLKAIQEFTALGSGYKLAMRDLEIRGAGNLLGAQQSGHIFEVGFDLYCELLDEAVKEIQGEKTLPAREVEVDLKVEASIPSGYVTDDRQRIALYRRMNSIADQAGIEEIRKEILDRFGKIPQPVETLFRIIGLKLAALGAGVQSIKEKEGLIRIEWFSKKVKLIDSKRGDKIRLALQGIAQ